MTESFELYLTDAGIELRRQAGLWGRKRVEVVGECAWNSGQLSTLDLRSFNLMPNRSLRVWLGSSLSRLMAIDLPAGLKNRQEQSAAMQATVQHNVGLTATAWVLTTDFIAPPKKSMVAAVDRMLLARLLEAAQENRLRLTSVRPVVANLWNIFQKANSTLADSVLVVVEMTAFTVLVQRQGSLDASYTFSGLFEMSLIEKEIRRLDISFGRNQPPICYFALDSNLAQTIHLHQDKMPLATHYAHSQPYADFRDRFFYLEYQR